MVVSSFRRIRSRPLLGAILALTIAVAGGLVIATQSGVALAATVGSPTPIVGVQSGRCMDVPNSSTTNGTQVQLWDCSGGSNQSWTLHVRQAAAGVRQQVPGRQRPGHHQRHHGDHLGLQRSGQPAVERQNSDGTVTGVQSGLCLDANGAGTANGTTLDPLDLQRREQPAVEPVDDGRRPPPSAGAGSGPCDIYAAGGTPCVAAHSTIRALYRSYSGNLYQVRRSSDNATRDIGVLAAGGYANAAAQDSFCSGTTCVITVVYDQSGHGNDLWYQGSARCPARARAARRTRPPSR